MKASDPLLAKSWDPEGADKSVPTFARLVPHLRAVERAGKSIVEIAGELILRQLDLPLDPWLPRLQRAVTVGCLCHDIGKANEGFQKMVRGELDPRQQPARHELLSALLLADKTSPVRGWALEQLTLSVESGDSETLLNCVIGAVAGHHLKLDEEWKKAALALRGGCGTELRMMLTHPDLEHLFHKKLIECELCYSLIEGAPGSLDACRFPFNLKSNRWRDRISKDPAWWRFAAAVKALVTAADVAGSAMLPKAENIRNWVHLTLSHRATAALMNEVVSARLKAETPRPFQTAIGGSKARVTLVEAGCGSGKTAAAYLWAAHHAHGKKLFFCYPTTGTATEGFLGYVHETDVEAKLMHSRAIVDLDGIAKVTDDEVNDHLLRIESLSAWSPQAVICTADTVLALVRNNRRGLYNSPAILSGAFVFDELHAYDNPMLAAVVAMIKALPGASFLLMTASLPKDRKEFLFRHIEGISEVPSPRDLEEIPRYEFQRLADEDPYRLARAAVTERKRVLWICNTVVRAQKVFEELGSIARNYHSRFKYTDRVKRHREIVDTFASDEAVGVVAVTTQVAEMSLDLDADLLISEIAPIPSLIQRLGRLNRRVTPEQPGSPRTAFFLTPRSGRPYNDGEQQLAERWLGELMERNRPLSQADLSGHFNALSPKEELQLDRRTAWLDSGWLATPEPLRDIGYSVSVILPEDEPGCRRSRSEIIKRSVPMNYDHRRMNAWPELKGNLLAPRGAIDYDAKRGAVWL